MYSKQFLTYGGVILVAAGILGLIGVLGPTAERSIFSSGWFFNSAESWLNIIFGAIALLVGFSLSDESRKWTASIIAILAVLGGLGELFLPSTFASIMASSSTSVVTALFYLAFGAWGLWASMSGITRPTLHGPSPRAQM